MKDKHQQDYLIEQIKQDPNILFLMDEKKITEEEIKIALESGFHPTRQQLLDHPILCQNPTFMRALVEKDPTYLPFDRNLSFVQKQTILASYLLKEDWQAIEMLPFFDSRFGAEVKGKDICKILRTFYHRFDEYDLNTQQFYYNIMNHIIDGIADLRYDEKKKITIFANLDQINMRVLACFRGIDSYNMQFRIDELAERMVCAVKDKSQKKSYVEKLYQLYAFYHNYHQLPYEKTTEFYKDILNRQKNAFKKEEKQKIITTLKAQLTLTDKKKHKFFVALQLEKSNQFFQKRDYTSLGMEEKKLKIALQELHPYLNSIKALRKANVYLEDGILQQLDILFLNGNLTKDTIDHFLPTVDRKIQKIILNQYNKIKFPYLKHLDIPFEEVEKKANHVLEYHYSNYIIASKEKYVRNLASLVLFCSKEKVFDLLLPQKHQKEISNLIVLADYFEEFGIKTMEDILSNEERILRQMKDSYPSSACNFNFILSHFAKFVKIARAYGSTDDITIAILGNDVVEKLLMKGFTSKDPKKYVDVYQKMLKRKYTTIPPVAGDYQNYSYASAADFDLQRLLIGKNCYGSCIGLGGAGEEAYLSCLTKKNADVVLIKDQKTGNFVARTLVFRKGNFVIMAPIHDEMGIADKFYIREFLDPIGQEMLTKAQEVGDNLKYVFLTNVASLLDGEYPDIEHPVFKDDFPHADLEEEAYLIAGLESEVDPDGTLPILGKYETLREKIKTTQEIGNEDISKLRALSVLLEKDPHLREEKARNYECFEKKDYLDVYKGTDWYLAMRKDGSLETVILPLNLKKAKQEMTFLKQNSLVKGGRK